MAKTKTKTKTTTLVVLTVSSFERGMVEMTFELPGRRGGSALNNGITKQVKALMGWTRVWSEYSHSCSRGGAPSPFSGSIGTTNPRRSVSFEGTVDFWHQTR